MKIAYKLVASYGIMAVLAGLVGFFGLAASKQIVRSFEGGEKHFRAIVAAATEVSSNAKAAESHLMLFVTLNDTIDREKFLKRVDALSGQVAILDELVKIPEARNILEKIKIDEVQLRSIGNFLVDVYENELKKKGRFDFNQHRAQLRRVNDVAASLRRRGIELAQFETDFLNRQEAISAASEANSFATRAEGHLMLYLALNDPIDRKKFFARIDSLKERIAILDTRVTIPEARRVLESVKASAEDLHAAGRALLVRYDSDKQRWGRFAFERNREMVKTLHKKADAVRDNAVRLADLNLSLEMQPKNLAIQFAADMQRNIVVVVIAAVLLSLALGYAIARSIADPITRLKEAALRIGRGKLDSDINVTTRDEIGDLAGNFRRMAGELQKITVSRNYMDNIITNMLDSLIAFSPTGTINRVNPAACTLLGYEEDELVNRSATGILVDASLFDRLMEEGRISGVETMFRSKGGSRIPVMLSGSVMRDDEGTVQGIVIVAQDLTGRKKMEEELIKSEKLQSVGILAGGIAHDFNNFLTIASGNVELLKESIPREDKRFKRVLEAEKALHRAEKLTRQLLTFSRGGAPLRKAASIAELIRESAHFPVSGSRVQCEQTMPDDLWPVDVDEGQISQVINNLVMNAVQAMPEGGTVRVSCENVSVHHGEVPHLREGHYVKIAISDEGPGISGENLQKIFDPYFTTKEMGSGLGLAISYSIVKYHEGHITVDSEEGRGTTFSIYLPVSRGAPRSSPDEQEKIFTGSGKVLVMDDELSVQDVAGQILQRIGYAVEFAGDGAEAIERYRSAKKSGEPFDAVIIDLTIPGGMGGKEAIVKLREFDPQVKAIVSSGYSNDPVMADHRKYGFLGVVPKPYRIHEMSRVLHEVLTGEEE